MGEKEETLPERRVEKNLCYIDNRFIFSFSAFSSYSLFYGELALKITVCACTLQRPGGLASLLASFRGLRTTDTMELDFLIVDNDLTPSAQGVFDRETQNFPWPCRLVHEPRPGVPSARERALQELGDVDYFAFVDDDETVDANWLVELVKIARTTCATFVQGPVQMTVDREEDEWWLRTLFFRQHRYPDGARLVESWTNNVLVELAFVRLHDCHFDLRMRFNSGEDTLFFQDIVRAGGWGAYAANAWVYETQGEARLRWKWALHRQFNYGRTRALTYLLRKPFLASIAYCAMRAGALTGVCLCHVATIPFRGRIGVANSLALGTRACALLYTAASALFSDRLRAVQPTVAIADASSDVR
ncbi:glycosyltransferase [Alloyangia pacifica]|uniref:glycosyltransferase n=1 Tax=Alloyangia pacifica TaxID=311180 RepID=UPI001CD614F5|nr:glycosyltransferase family A protein [Alloyangia pacifica]MCA0997314.1 glycosyltransferase family 2 protein [Alloyangia pacifica]